jgi:leucyl aminopeptidase
MDLSYVQGDPLAHDGPLLAIPLFQGEEALPAAARAADDRLGGALSRALASGDFRGREGESLLFYLPGDTGPARLVFLGAGKWGEADAETLRKVGGRAVRAAESLSLTEMAVLSPGLPEASGPGGGGEGPGHGVGLPALAARALSEGLALAAWDFRELFSPRTGDDARKPLVVRGSVLGEGDPGELERAVRAGWAAAEGENLARTLQSRPGNVATPTHLAEVAGELAREHGFELRTLGPKEMEEEGMGALLSVAKGSDQEPRLIVLVHRGGGDGEAPVALVGKGLTFDSGGISLKPPKGMEEMKYDMSGGAAVLGAMKTVGLLGLPLNVVAVVPSSENLINGSANKPGDVIRTRAGKTVEIINTDAEGRLILADALSYTVDHFSPAAIVDCATLTGACVIALGHHAAAVLGTDEELVQELRDAGDRSGERCWPLPLWKPYRKQLESSFADLKNVGGRPAGTITAGWFLSEFVGEVRWAHLDIAGTAYGESDLPYRRKGAFGFPTRLLVEWVERRAG